MSAPKSVPHQSQSFCINTFSRKLGEVHAVDVCDITARAWGGQTCQALR